MKESALRELQNFEESLKFESLITSSPQLSDEALEERVKIKASEIAEEFRSESDSAVSNIFSDLLALTAFGLVIATSKREIVILKSFIDDIVYGLSGSAKAFIIILFTDIFVGFHSPHGWEVGSRVLPSESTARYRYFHSPFTSIYVSSTRPSSFVGRKWGRQRFSNSGL